MNRVVIDTNVFISAALRHGGGAARSVLRLALQRSILPIFGNALLAEYEAVLGRPELFAQSPLTKAEREELLNALISVSEWAPVYYLWRPNLRDESDNHLIDLAIAANANAVITANVRDLRSGEILTPHLKILNPGDYLKQRAYP